MSKFARNLIVAAVTAMLLALIAAAAFGDEWNWSPPAEHHKAAVRVRSGQNAGSGVYIAAGQLRGVLTAAHVIGANASATVYFSDGTSTTGSATSDKYRNDVAFVSVEHPGIAPLAIAVSPPREGGRVEFVTYGGPQARLRSFWSTFQGEQQLINGVNALYATAVTPGDSGGGILNERREVVGIQSAGRGDNINRGGDWPVYRGSISATCGAIRAFVQRVHRQVFGGRRGSQPACPDGKCPDHGGGIAWERGGKVEFYPPWRREKPPVLPGPGPAEEEKSKPPAADAPSLPKQGDTLAAALGRLKAIDKALADLSGNQTNLVNALADAKKAQAALDDRLGQVAESVSEGRLKGLLAEAVEGLPGSRPEPEPEGPIAANPPTGKGGGVPWDLLVAGAAGALGFGVPPWAFLALRGLRAARKLRKARQRSLSPPSRNTETTVVVDAPAAVERRRIDTQFVNVESDHYQRAHELARQEIARRYPGAQEILAAELDLTRQFAAGIPAT